VTAVAPDFIGGNMAKGYAMRLDEQTASDRIREKTNGLLEYISGYTIKEKPVRVRCTVCGGEFERTYHNITTKRSVTCPYCVESNRKAKRIKQDQEKEERKRKAQVNKIRNAKQLRMVVCEICGETFFTWDSRQKYCSISCRKESARRYAAYNHGSDDRLNKSNIIDRDIDLKELFKRDKGICQICGGLCDYSDCYTNDNGTFIAGNTYPSKDHIIPLSYGGKHSWDNVRLAHRGCNSKFYWKNQRSAPLPIGKNA
jgi:uncharacterized Zn-finger protein